MKIEVTFERTDLPKRLQDKDPKDIALVDFIQHKDIIKIATFISFKDHKYIRVLKARESI